MAKSVVIYDSIKWRDEGPAYAKQIGATPYGVRGEKDLIDVLSKLTQVDHMTIYSHGLPGALVLGGTSTINASDIRKDFNNFGNVFAADAEVEILGCNVAAIQAGCTSPAKCADTDNGVIFLRTFAKTFFKRGGSVCGWTSAGFTFSWSQGTPHHATGFRVYAFVNPRQKLLEGVRIAWGEQLDTPYDHAYQWRVWDGKEFFYYQFDPVGKGKTPRHGKAYWLTEADWKDGDSFYGDDDADKERQGSWSMDGDYLRIEWSDEVETWDLPLFSEFQTGLSMNNDPKSPRIPYWGRPGIDGSAGDVWAETVAGRENWLGRMHD